MTSTAALLLMIQQLQDALLAVEWVRSHDKTWRCPFCAGLSEEDGGEGHREGCSWTRLTGWHPGDDVEAP